MFSVSHFSNGSCVALLCVYIISTLSRTLAHTPKQTTASVCLSLLRDRESKLAALARWLRDDEKKMSEKSQIPNHNTPSASASSHCVFSVRCKSRTNYANSKHTTSHVELTATAHIPPPCASCHRVYFTKRNWAQSIALKSTLLSRFDSGNNKNRVHAKTVRREKILNYYRSARDDTILFFFRFVECIAS